MCQNFFPKKPFSLSLVGTRCTPRPPRPPPPPPPAASSPGGGRRGPCNRRPLRRWGRGPCKKIESESRHINTFSREKGGNVVICQHFLYNKDAAKSHQNMDAMAAATAAS